MKYEVQNRNDFGAGALLVARIDESDLDKKALRTIQSERPEFILPFNCRSIDGQIEFVYQLGSREKMKNQSGVFKSAEYAAMWVGLLNPLLECEDWFMKPYSFVLDAEYLYFDRQKNTVCYLYIPSADDCCDNNALKEMAGDLSRQITVDDAGLELTVLRAIMKDFSPTELLQNLKPHMASGLPAAALPPVAEAAVAERPAVYSHEPEKARQDIPERIAEEDGFIENEPASPLDIVINIPVKKKDEKKPKRWSKNKAEV